MRRLVFPLLLAGMLFAGYQSATGNGYGTAGGERGMVRPLLGGDSRCVAVFPDGPGIAPSACLKPDGSPAPGVALESDVGPAGDLGARGFGAVLTRQQVAELWLKHGGDPSQVRTAVAVATAESGRQGTAANTSNDDGSQDYGLWQINNIHRVRFEQVTGVPYSAGVNDPDLNTRFAVFLQHEQGWRPWVAYTSGSYLKHLEA